MAEAASTPRKRRKRQVRVTVNDRMQMWADGEITIDDMDEEKLKRGQFRNAQGDFRGAPPKYIPREFYQQVEQRRYKEFLQQFQEMLPDAMRTIWEMNNSRNLSPGDKTRFEAAKYIVERVYGKIPDSVQMKLDANVNHEMSFDDVFEEVLVDVKPDIGELKEIEK